ncbi:putative UDP-N-acetylglucosamine--peptide N-acetylglucosaminyltransferase SEC [Frankliniella fusca]|uniref:UDP-N-acetylglucosamine--peptide N-acetylglucosaminyltransferase SEC n=1 Tax=Frankliniella fusca TaxID=407009 RepID=A0AAE1HXC8_9NEOP|nr:putative UDP-N-acetylglucosamine--peptide N-acetylglucosaminyltransferase SEC [Frankliniella fusca]
MDKVMAENQELRKQIVQNAGKKKGGLRYHEVLKEFGAVVYTLGGPMLYSIFSSNFPLPALATTSRVLHSCDPIIEGKWRFTELKEFLVKRNFPLVIWVSEDGTRVNGRIQYDVKTNQIVGFVPSLDTNGLPVIQSFPATSASVIKSYFENCTVSSNAYAIMAQPLAQNAPTFCLALWGTDNRFKSTDVLARWRWMVQAASEEGITVAGVSSDGDSKLLSAMYNCTFRNALHNWPWFYAELKPTFVTVQDTIHLLIKLRQKLIKPSDIMPMGNINIASRGHLVSLISSVAKDNHKLTMSSINVKDKMNFKSAQDLCAKEVSNLLRKEVPGSEGTAVFLDMMRETSAAFLEQSLKPLERINMVWTWIFFTRFWRQYILSNRDYSLSHNFITSNAYTCMEINGHALIQIIIKLRDSELHELFIPVLFGSQACEDFFRKCLKDDIVFPRQHKKLWAHQNSEARFDILPEDWEIEKEIAAAFKRAVQILLKVGILKKETKIYPTCPLPSLATCELPSLDDNDNDDEDENIFFVEQEQSLNDETLQDVEEDLLTISTGALGIQTYDNIEVSSTSPFVLVSDGKGNPSLIKKTTLVWMFSNGDTTMSSDRLRRVQADAVIHRPSSTSTSPTETPYVEDFVTIGDWCGFVSEDRKSISYGRVLAFSYLTGTTWRSQQYVNIEAPVKPPANCDARGVGCLCTWYKLLKNKKLQVTTMDVHGYYNIENYICTLPRPIIKDSNLFLNCSENDVRKLKKSRKHK